MLAPRDRTLLLESLRPPDGYSLDRAIATTYTLDLIALLTAPLAFTFFDWEDEEGRPSADPLALLEAVRRNARRLHVFCHGGAIHAPRPGQVLLGYLEACVVEVSAPRGGVFHPKVWVLRFEESRQGSGEGVEVRYRLIVSTRNLTFDRSWDTVLVIDGALTTRKNAIASNRGLAEFIRRLPDLARREAPAEARAAAKQLGDEVLRVRWDLPEEIQEMEFLSFGLSSRKEPWPFGVGRRGLVVSPFIDGSFLKKFADVSEEEIIVSRPEALAAIAAEDLSGFSERYVLAPEAEEEPGSEDGGGDEIASSDPEETPSGLHAKLFVIDDGRNAQVFTGSANATMAAFERNVEVLIRLKGRKAEIGIEAVLSRRDSGGLMELLEQWRATDVEEDPEAAAKKELERRVGRAREAIAAAELDLQVKSTEDPDTFVLGLHGVWPPLEDSVLVRCWPAVLSDGHAIQPMSGDPIAEFQASLGAATGFLAFEITSVEMGLEHSLRFVRRLPISGFPADRVRRLLRSMLKDSETVMRLIYLLLCSEEVSANQVAQFASGSKGGGSHGSGGLPLLEALVQALERGGGALDPVEHLVRDLSGSEEGRALLPSEFWSLWESILVAAKEVES